MIFAEVDLLRIAFLAIFGAGLALMLITNVIAYMVLRPPRKLGFLWWHVSAISFSFLCFGSATISITLSRLGQDVDADWRTWAVALGTLSFTTSQVIIFNIEKQRLADTQAQKIKLKIG